MPLNLSTTYSPCSTTGQNYKCVRTVERFYITTEDDRNDEHLIKLGSIHCQGTCTCTCVCTCTNTCNCVVHS